MTHRTDYDGIASGALIVRYAYLHLKEPFMAFLKDYSDGPNVIEEPLTKLKACKLYIADLSTSFKDLPKVADRIKRMGCDVYWFDHHPTSEENVNLLRDVGVNLDLREDRFVAAKIVFQNLYEKMGIEDEVARRISDYAVETDNWRFESKETQDLMDLVSFYDYLDDDSSLTPNLMSFLLHLAGLKEIDLLLTEMHRKHIVMYREMLEGAKELILKTADLFELNGVKYAVTYSPNLVSGSRAADYILSAYDVDVALVIKEDGTASVRRKGEIDVSKIAKLFGGGGHPYAAGMKLTDEKIPKEKFLKVLEMIKERLKDLKPS